MLFRLGCGQHSQMVPCLIAIPLLEKGGRHYIRLEGEDFSWTGTPDLSKYTLNIDAQQQRVRGSVSFHPERPFLTLSLSLRLNFIPANRLPWSLSLFSCEARSGHAIYPHLGWAGAAPDADSSVSLEISGDKLSFKRPG
jgi:hypothetical protein